MPVYPPDVHIESGAPEKETKGIGMKKKTLAWIAVAAVVGLVVLGLAGASPFSMFMLSDDMHNTTNARPPSGNAGGTAGSNEGDGNGTQGNGEGSSSTGSSSTGSSDTSGTGGDGNAGHGDNEDGYDPDNPGKSTGTNRGGNAEGGDAIDTGDGATSDSKGKGANSSNKGSNAEGGAEVSTGDGATSDSKGKGTK